ncbi:hypothetical protein ACIA5A_21275 [Micromonospora sp. NPDC051300]|uniref:hypothetical protein n=1 Tax=Micromonospora sp. NPDC051300 TaxID=3364286 RepID=UPI0037A00AEC
MQQTQLLADVLECELQVAALLPDFRFAHSWYQWPAHMLEQSPVLVEVVDGHPGWWPALHALRHSIDEPLAGPVAHPLVGAPAIRPAGTRLRLPRLRGHGRAVRR